MNISIFGLGYVGCVGLGCLAERGHNLIGIDVDFKKVELINNGKATIIEKGIDELIRKNYESGKIRSTRNSMEGVENSEVAIICVGTPNDDRGHLDMLHIYKVAEEIGKSLRAKNGFFTIAIRSTVMPGTNKKLGEIVEKTSGKKFNVDFGVVSNPEFLREGSAIDDFFNPPYTVLASESKEALESMKTVYEGIKGEVIVTDIGAAELIKFVNNSYHGLKVAFANEVGRICKMLNIDSMQLMDLFIRDKILNISPVYFRPGFAYGGSCLPKDLKALNSIAHDNYVDVPILSSIGQSNDKHINYAFNLIVKKQKKKIGFYGLSFKQGTDDLRFSPALELVERLLGKGYDVKIFDRNVHLSKLMGKNREFLLNKLPHINDILIEDLKELVDSSDVIVLVNKDDKIFELLDKDLTKANVIDFVRVNNPNNHTPSYEGICW